MAKNNWTRHRWAKKRGLAAYVVLLCTAVTTALATDGFDLRVDDVSGIAEPWPLLGGLPFPQGALTDGDRIRIVRDGVPVPAQIDVVARWGDGSIRWALAGFTGIPQGEYRVEFGDDVTPAAPVHRLQVEQTDDGGVLVDTGVARYAFSSQGLMPETADLGGVRWLSDGAHGAYLVDNNGRLARVAGDEAEVTTRILKSGQQRVVIRRDGWYVTADGERIARARAWFYFVAGTPVVHITHSLIFTEDTNNVWVRDYGLEFPAGQAPKFVLFNVGEKDEGTLVEVIPAAGDAVYMLQDTFPHFRESESLGVVGRMDVANGFRLDPTLVIADTFWLDDWLYKGAVVGDWADVSYGNVAVTVVMPNLARRFPKEIAVGPDGFRTVFWSGRSGRELDFRTATLINEYWQTFAEAAPEGPMAFAARPSNAAGTGRTHDVWLIPSAPAVDVATVQQRARAAQDIPLVQPDPEWLTASMAVGWPMHPVDDGRFADQEALIRNYWDRLESGRQKLNFNGFIDFGRHSTIRGLSQFFRLSGIVDYGVRTHVWGLYGRSGDRRYYDYATNFNRFAGDWSMASWDADGKFAGGVTDPRDISYPLYWGERTALHGSATGDDIGNWILEYYMTGDEYAADRVEMIADAFRNHFDPSAIPEIMRREDSCFSYIRKLGQLYQWDGDPLWVEWGNEWLNSLVDFSEPTGITDRIRYGSLYKIDRNLLNLYLYYNATSDERAKRAILQALDYKYRFAEFGSAFSGQAYTALLYAIGYRWTGNPDFLRMVEYIVANGDAPAEQGPSNIHNNMHPTMSLPWALAVLAEVDGPIDPYPVVTQFFEPDSSVILFRKQSASQPVTFSMRLQMDKDFLEPEPVVCTWSNGHSGTLVGGLKKDVQLALQPSVGLRGDPKKWHVLLTVPADVPAGLYTLEVPHATHVDVLDSTAAETAIYAPNGFRTRGDNVEDFFFVPEGVEQVHLFLGFPMIVRRSDGSIAVGASRENIGELIIDTNGESGAWSVESAESGVVQLFTGEPIFSRSPEWLVTGAEVVQPERFQPPSSELAFVAGQTGQALHVPKGTVLTFPRGPADGDRYACFPGSEGTIEFRFRPNWSSTTLAYTLGGNFNDHYFLRSGSHALQYRRGKVRSDAPEFAAVNLWAYGTDSNSGFSGKYLFEAGQWYHIAITWRTVDGTPGDDGEYALYVNGEPVARTVYNSAPTFWPGGLTGNRPFKRKDASEQILIGPIDGTISSLRISDKVRYTERFTPAATIDQVDDNTRVLFPLDGSWTGMSADGTVVELNVKK